jgi:hypothetical protein
MKDQIPRQRLERLARAIHPLGERALYHLLADLQEGEEFPATVERYVEPFGDFIRAHGGDRLPEPRLVAGGLFRGCSNTREAGRRESTAAE